MSFLVGVNFFYNNEIVEKAISLISSFMDNNSPNIEEKEINSFFWIVDSILLHQDVNMAKRKMLKIKTPSNNIFYIDASIKEKIDCKLFMKGIKLDLNLIDEKPYCLFTNKNKKVKYFICNDLLPNIEVK